MSNTLWSPRLPRHAAPIYRAIADALEKDVTEGVLRDGTRLPTHRELADRLGVTPLTITRAYKEAARRGLIDSTVGRGTFVRTVAPAHETTLVSESTFVDLSKNIVEGSGAIDLDGRVTNDLRSLLRDPNYPATEGTFRHRSAAAAFLNSYGVTTEADRVILTPGAQPAILSILAALCHPGDTIFAEELTYPRLTSMAAFLHLKVQPLPCDEEGVIPRAFEKAFRNVRPKAAYLIPNFQNPTGTVMPLKRRQEIAAIARRNQLPIIEDDVYGFLLEDRFPPISALTPDFGCHVTSLSKSLTPSLRLGFASVPTSMVERVTSAFAAMTAFTSTLSAEVFTQLFENGVTNRVMAEKREMVRTNRRIAERALEGVSIEGHQMSPHLWLRLPAHCDARELSDRTRQRGIDIAPAAAFALTRSNLPSAVRISIGATKDGRQLEKALRTIASLATDTRMTAAATVV